MGKLRRQRQKLHSPAKYEKSTVEDQSFLSTDTAPLLSIASKDNVFAGIDINFDKLKKQLSDDVHSIKSYKSVKSNIAKLILPKKDKIKLRREILLKKIDTVNQLKKEIKIRNKRKNTSIIGDTNPLHDALPSLNSLLKSKTNIKYTSSEPVTKKSVEKSSKRKRELIRNISVYKQTLKNKSFKTNPLKSISEHIKSIVDNERRLCKK